MEQPSTENQTKFFRFQDNNNSIPHEKCFEFQLHFMNKFLFTLIYSTQIIYILYYALSVDTNFKKRDRDRDVRILHNMFTAFFFYFFFFYLFTIGTKSIKTLQA